VGRLIQVIVGDGVGKLPIVGKEGLEKPGGDWEGVEERAKVRPGYGQRFEAGGAFYYSGEFR
jgi:hypothetical protein